MKIKREDLLKQIENRFPTISRLDDLNIMIWCMTQEEQESISSVAKFIAIALDLRSKFLSYKKK